MSGVIVPTVGRIVWFRDKRPTSLDQQAEAAVIANVPVKDGSRVNIEVFGRFSDRLLFDVPLIQEGQVTPDYRYCEWMPYQKGQAAKTEALEEARRMASAGDSLIGGAQGSG